MKFTDDDSPAKGQQSFSDADLKRCKDDLAKFGGANPFEIEIRPGLLRALLARLEAGEAILKKISEYGIDCDRETLMQLLQAWRKAAGK